MKKKALKKKRANIELKVCLSKSGCKAKKASYAALEIF